MPIGTDAVTLKLELVDGQIRCWMGPAATNLTRIPGEWSWRFLADGPGFLGPGIGTVDEIRIDSNAPFTLVADGRRLQVETGKTVFKRKD